MQWRGQAQWCSLGETSGSEAWHNGWLGPCLARQRLQIFFQSLTTPSTLFVSFSHTISGDVATQLTCSLAASPTLRLKKRWSISGPARTISASCSATARIARSSGLGPPPTLTTTATPRVRFWTPRCRRAHAAMMCPLNNPSLAAGKFTAVGTTASVTVLRDLEPNAEVTCFYGVVRYAFRFVKKGGGGREERNGGYVTPSRLPRLWRSVSLPQNFFGPNNEHCGCKTCER